MLLRDFEGRRSGGDRSGRTPRLLHCRDHSSSVLAMLLVLIPRGRRVLTTARMISGARKASGMVSITWRLVELSMEVRAPRYIWWNFVSSRPERIDQAKEEWACAAASIRCRGTRRSSFPCPKRRTGPGEQREGFCIVPRPRARSSAPRKEAMALEGIVSKEVTSRFKSGSCKSWLKVKNPAYREANGHLKT